MRDQENLHHCTPYPGHWSGGIQLQSVMKGHHALSATIISELSRIGKSGNASDSDGDMFGNAIHTNLLPKHTPEPTWIPYVYNREGAEYLAKDIRGCARRTGNTIPENGRIYQGERIENYMLPCDEKEQDRLDFIHTMVMNALKSDRLTHVPHTPNGRFLDLGCGTGIWAIEMARVYPNAYVLGLDISAIQPKFTPPNCVFKAPFDYELPWLMGEGQWDVIHMQMGCGSVTNWPNLYKKIFDHLRCGAWFEQLEINFEPRCNDRLPDQSSLKFWYQSLKTATKATQRKVVHSPERTLCWLREAEFSKISHREIVLPLNPGKQPVYDQTAAQWFRTAFVESIEPLSLAPLSRLLGWAYEEIQSVVAAAVTEALDPNIDVYYTLHLYKARKP